jgi:hypothetical protein
MRLALLLALAAEPALAAVPEKGEGTITLLGGARYLWGNGDFIQDQFAAHKVFQPGGVAAFGYQYDDELHFKIEIGYLYDSYRIPGGDLVVKTIPILLALDTVLLAGKWFTLYGGGGLGYSLNTGTRGSGSPNEANSTAGYVAIGFRVRLGGPVALVLEDRLQISSAQVDSTYQKPLNVGGNLLSVGLMFHFLEPEEKGRPKPP